MAEIDVTRTGRGAGTAVLERTGFRLSMGAIVVGFVIATALQIVFSTLGAAIGFAAFDPGQGDSAGGLGIGAAIWFALTAIVSMFVGGMTTGRLAGVLNRSDGMLHGIAVWAFSTLLAVYLLGSGASRVLGGVTGFLGQTAASAVGGAASGAGQVGAAVINQQSNDGEREMDFDALQREIETTLGQTGNPALSPDSIQADAQQAQTQATQSPASNQQVAREIGDMVRQRRGEVGREEIVNVIAARTGKSRAEAEQLADRVQGAVSTARGQISQTANQAQARAGEVAGDAANSASKAAWGALLVMGLSVAAAAFGAARTAPE